MIGFIHKIKQLVRAIWLPCIVWYTRKHTHTVRSTELLFSEISLVSKTVNPGYRSSALEWTKPRNFHVVGVKWVVPLLRPRRNIKWKILVLVTCRTLMFIGIFTDGQTYWTNMALNGRNGTSILPTQLFFVFIQTFRNLEGNTADTWYRDHMLLVPPISRTRILPWKLCYPSHLMVEKMTRSVYMGVLWCCSSSID